MEGRMGIRTCTQVAEKDIRTTLYELRFLINQIEDATGREK
jgi:hypothetical protein